jgi:hypothetical protein
MWRATSGKNEVSAKFRLALVAEENERQVRSAVPASTNVERKRVGILLMFISYRPHGLSHRAAREKKVRYMHVERRS